MMVAIGLEAWVTDSAGGWRTHRAFFSPAVDHVVSAAPGLVAIGTACTDVCGPLPEVLVWRSTAGLGWSPDPHARSLEGGTVIRPVAWGDRVVLVGSFGAESRVRAAAWHDGGADWTAAELPDGQGRVARAIAAAGSGLYAIGSDWSEPDQRLAAWASSDGLTWTSVILDGLKGRPVAMAERGGTLVAITDAGVWHAALPSGAPEAPPPPRRGPVVGADGCLLTDSPGFRDVLLLDPADRVRCLGGRELTLEAWIVPMEGGGVCPARTPAWLAACDPALQLLPAPGPDNGIFDVYVDPSIELTSERNGKMARFQGRFDDPRALTCRSDEPANDPAAIRGEELIRRCRESFVVTKMEILE
jgi:hypothetical protein